MATLLKSDRLGQLASYVIDQSVDDALIDELLSLGVALVHDCRGGKDSVRFTYIHTYAFAEKKIL